MVSRVRGTQDFLDLSLYNRMLHEIKSHLDRYHFSEIETPIIEPVELFQRSLGTHTDIVSKEMFVLETAGGEKICLRPEMTASTVRAFVENGIQSVPWKVYSHGSLFRYERPQKGRYRQFHQCNIELLSADSILHDIDLICMLDRLFHERFHLDSYALMINFLGCAQDRVAYKEQLQAFLYKLQNICQTCVIRREKNPLRVFDCKEVSCQGEYQNAPRIIDSLCDDCEQEWKTVQESLSLLSVTYVVNSRLVRGLDYYDKTAFEFVSTALGAQNAFCGGGRYNGLVSQLYEKRSANAVGAAIGMERLLLALQATNPLYQGEQVQKKAVQVIIPLSEGQKMLGLLIADSLRAADFCVEVMVDDVSLKTLMKRASKMGASHALIIGEDEQKNRTVTVKNMFSGDQESVCQADLISYLKK